MLRRGAQKTTPIMIKVYGTIASTTTQRNGTYRAEQPIN
jgi:hypothetical protein